MVALSGCVSAAGPLCKATTVALAAVRDDFSAAAGCLVRRGDRLLVVRDRKTGRLGFPAGGPIAGETPPCTAHRETWEETGIDVQVEELLHVVENGFHLYQCTLTETSVASSGQQPVPQHALSEISSVAWLRLNQITPDDWRIPGQLPLVSRLFAQSKETTR
ncbi:MAG: 8-oxo-dGTP diphosphatase [Hyphomicrobiaceae bacterium]